MENIQVTVTLPKHIKKTLDRLAKEQHRSLSGQIAHYVMQTLRELEE